MIGAVLAGALALLATLIVAGTVALERRNHLFGRLEIESSPPRAKPRMPTNALVAVAAVAAWILGGRAAGGVG